MQSKLRKFYEKFEILPPIKVETSITINIQNEKFPSLKEKCLKNLPWYSVLLNRAERRESISKFDTIIDREIKTHLVNDYVFDQPETERYYRNCESKVLNLQPQDFLLHYRHRMKRLKLFQMILTGDNNLIVNNADYLQGVKNELETREERFRIEQSRKMTEKEIIRDRLKKILYPVEDISTENDPKRKFFQKCIPRSTCQSLGTSMLLSPVDSNSEDNLHSNKTMEEVYKEAEDMIRLFDFPTNRIFDIILLHKLNSDTISTVRFSKLNQLTENATKEAATETPKNIDSVAVEQCCCFKKKS